MPALSARTGFPYFVGLYFPVPIPRPGAPSGAPSALPAEAPPACKLPPVAGPWALPTPAVFWLTRAPRTLDFVDTRPVVPVVVATPLVPVDTPTPTCVPPQPGPQPEEA